MMERKSSGLSSFIENHLTIGEEEIGRPGGAKKGKKKAG